MPELRILCVPSPSLRALALGCAVLVLAGGCGDDDAQPDQAISTATSCRELVEEIEFADLSEEEAERLADKVLELASADLEDDDVIDELFQCNTVVRRLDRFHPEAAARLDLEELGALAES